MSRSHTDVICERSRDYGVRSPGSNSPTRNERYFTERRIYVSNIPYNLSCQQLKELFKKEVGDITLIELFVNDDDHPAGCAIIDFACTSLCQEAAQKMNRWDIKGRKLVVKRYGDFKCDERGRLVEFCGISVRGKNASSWNPDWGSTYGLSEAFLTSLGINGPLSSNVFVANLDQQVDEKMLKEVFELAGCVRSVNLAKNEGVSRGHGTVEYHSPLEAVQAISMLHGQILNNHKLVVRLDKKTNDRITLPEGLQGVGKGLGNGGLPMKNLSTACPYHLASELSWQISDQNQPINDLAQKAALTSLEGDNFNGSDIHDLRIMAYGDRGRDGNQSCDNFKGSNNNDLRIMAYGDKGRDGNQSRDNFKGSDINDWKSMAYGDRGRDGNQSRDNFKGSDINDWKSMAYGDHFCDGNRSRDNFKGSDINDWKSMAYGDHFCDGNRSRSGDFRDNFKDSNVNDQRSMAYGDCSRDGDPCRDGYRGRDEDRCRNGDSKIQTAIVSNIPPGVSRCDLQKMLRQVEEVKSVEMISKDVAIVKFCKELDANTALRKLNSIYIYGRQIVACIP